MAKAKKWLFGIVSIPNDALENEDARGGMGYQVVITMAETAEEKDPKTLISFPSFEALREWCQSMQMASYDAEIHWERYKQRQMEAAVNEVEHIIKGN